MRTLRRLVVVLALAGVGLIAAPSTPACACSCALSTTEEYRESADLVFVGTAREVDSPLFPGSSADPVDVTVDVTEVFKGTVPARVHMSTAVSGASCGYEFKEGTRYLIFARHNDGGLVTGLCSGNRDLSVETMPFGNGSAPTPTPPGTETFWSPAVIGVAVASGVVAAGLLVVWLVRRSKPPQTPA